ncbi:hypothetical protein QJ857_gp0756 [Tupanvirus soda lake]|uniref:ADP ribosyltransferase domain-containing protein n=2 Tax=Tupanvirus TaxID=2094720 RepID=A0A6N1NZC0_9VIRU|nr:hypothetical protein QJ857_gp0756 [Tupanvirus soda lake]QKU35292.1 hypothetical protein [Tupanvirus soda lake]
MNNGILDAPEDYDPVSFLPHGHYVFNDLDKYNLDDYQPINIKDFESKTITNLSELVVLIQSILYDITDITIKMVLNKTIEPYVIVGEKAYIKIINPINDNMKPFIFDIIYLGSARDAVNFTTETAKKLNEYINYKYGPIRFFIANLLSKYNLLDVNSMDHYYNQQHPLFIYGKKISKNDVDTVTIFLSLVLKNDLFTSSVLFDNSGQNNPSTNRLYLPIINVHTNAGRKISVFNYDANNIKYASVPEIIYEIVLKYTIGAVHETKLLENMSNNIYLLCNPELKFPCDVDTYNNKLIEDTQLINSGNYGSDELKLIVTNYIRDYYNSYDIQCTILPDICKSILLRLSENENSPLVNNYQTDRLEDYFNRLETIDTVYSVNTVKPIFHYTGGEHANINALLQLKNLGFALDDPMIGYLIGVNQSQIKVLEDIANGIHNSFIYMEQDNDYLIDKATIFNDEFTVYSTQTFLYFFDPQGHITDLNYLEEMIGSIIFMPNFLSTTYDPLQLSSFLRNDKVIYKIKINNLKKNWLLIDKYSQFPPEQEILIRANSFFTITNINYEALQTFDILGTSHEYNIKVITMTLCDNLQEAVEISKKIPNNSQIINLLDFADITSLFSPASPTTVSNEIIDITKLDDLPSDFFDLLTQKGANDPSTEKIRQKRKQGKTKLGNESIVTKKRAYFDVNGQTNDYSIINSYTAMITLEFFVKEKVNWYDNLVDVYLGFYNLLSKIIPFYLKKPKIITKKNTNTVFPKAIPIVKKESEIENEQARRKVVLPKRRRKTDTRKPTDLDYSYQPILVQQHAGDIEYRKKYLKYKAKYMKLMCGL